MDVFWSSKFLEDMDTAITATQRKEALRTIDQDSNGKMSCIEYLAWKFKKSPEDVSKRGVLGLDCFENLF